MMTHDNIKTCEGNMQKLTEMKKERDDLIARRDSLDAEKKEIARRLSVLRSQIRRLEADLADPDKAASREVRLALHQMRNP